MNFLNWFDECPAAALNQIAEVNASFPCIYIIFFCRMSCICRALSIIHRQIFESAYPCVWRSQLRGRLKDHHQFDFLLRGNGVSEIGNELQISEQWQERRDHWIDIKSNGSLRNPPRSESETSLSHRVKRCHLKKSTPCNGNIKVSAG